MVIFDLMEKEAFYRCPRQVWWKSCISIIGKSSVWGEMGIPFSRVKFLYFITQVLFLLLSRSCSFPNVNLSSQLHSNELLRPGGAITHHIITPDLWSMGQWISPGLQQFLQEKHLVSIWRLQEGKFTSPFGHFFFQWLIILTIKNQRLWT